ncbi:hypothetical protein AA313_de0200943 [Arthrobotrys entomopaga]|nr:hypothetical protein AA313_de0200943 [Arthrobotrys entomopaga]
MASTPGPRTRTPAEENRLERVYLIWNIYGNLEELSVAKKDEPKDLAPGLRPRLPPVIPKMSFGGFAGIPPPPPPPPPLPPPPPPPLTPLKRMPSKQPQETPHMPKSPSQLDVMDELKARLAKRNSQGRRSNVHEDQFSPYKKEWVFRDPERERVAARPRSPVVEKQPDTEVIDVIPNGKPTETSRSIEGIAKANKAGKENDARKESVTRRENMEKTELAQSSLSPIPEERAQQKPGGKTVPILDSKIRYREPRGQSNKLTEPVSPKDISPQSKAQPKIQEHGRVGHGEDQEEELSLCVLYTIRIFGLFFIFLGILKLEVYLGLLASTTEY